MISRDQDKTSLAPAASREPGVDEDTVVDGVPSRSDPDFMSEREEMARLMQTLREAIPYREDDDEDNEPEPPPVVDRSLARTSPPPPLPQPTEEAASPDEDDFARLLRSLRDSIPDESEMPNLDEADIEPPSAYPGDHAPDREEPTAPPAFHDDHREAASNRYPPEPDFGDFVAESEADHHDAQGVRHPSLAAGDEDVHSLEVAPGESAAIAELMNSLHGGAGRRSGSGAESDDDLDEVMDEDDLEPRSGWSMWKIAVVLGGAAAMGLAIALVNPFGDQSPQTSDRIMVPATTAVIDKGPVQTAEILRVVVPMVPPPKAVAPAPAPPPKPVVPVAVAPPPSPPPAPASAPMPAPPPVAALPPLPVPPPPAAPPPAPAPVQVAALPPQPAPPPAPALPPSAVAPPPAAPEPEAARLPAPPPEPVRPPVVAMAAAPVVSPPVAAPPTPASVVPAAPIPNPDVPLKPVAVPPPHVEAPAPQEGHGVRSLPADLPATPSRASPRPTPPPPVAVVVTAPPPSVPPHEEATPPQRSGVAPIKGEPALTKSADSVRSGPSAAPPLPSADEESAPASGGARVYTVQLGSFRLAENAEILIKSLTKQGFEVHTKDWTDGGGQLWHVVRVGRLTDRAAAYTLARQLAGKTGLEPDVLSVR